VDRLFREMMLQSCRIAEGYDEPRYNRDCVSEIARSKSIFNGDATVLACRKRVWDELDVDFGHGRIHSGMVCIDSGALVLVEAGKMGLDNEEAGRSAAIVQCAGLFHDIKRKMPGHAELGAAEADRRLVGTGVTDRERSHIVQAIANHEAFTRVLPVGDNLGQLISDALYDGDKFRWGPDNFTRTLWCMTDYMNASIDEIVRKFPAGMEGIQKIRDTFRTGAGKEYGPEIIDLGLRIGERVYEMLTDVLRTGRFRREKIDA